MTGTETLAIAVLRAMGSLQMPDVSIEFERPKNRDHGDWSCNAAFRLAKPMRKSPRDIAQMLISAIKEQNVEGVQDVTLGGAGFINFTFSSKAIGETVSTILRLGSEYGVNNVLEGCKVNVEFVSANPTGPLHAGHLRGAFLGDAIARVLSASGANVTKEYYLNDAGVQMETFATSIQARLRGKPVPSDGYRGDYIVEIADALNRTGVDPADLEDIRERSYRLMLNSISNTLRNADITFDVWLSERTLHIEDVGNAIEQLLHSGVAYEAEGATWLRTSDYGDDKDRVLVKSDGERTYFAADVAYLANKAGRGFDRCIYVLGADHHGYIGRLRAIAKAWGMPDDLVEVQIAQLVNLLRDGEAVKMSKRAGDILTANDILKEIGADAARYIYLRSSADTTLTVDMAEVVRADRDNPVHYINYSYARICGIARKASRQQFEPLPIDIVDLGLLKEESITALIAKLQQYPEVVQLAAQSREPYRIARYCESLADLFHSFYTKEMVLVEDLELASARFWLCEATKVTLENALTLLGVTPKEVM